MPAPSFALAGRRVVTPEGVRAATVVVREGRIAAVEAPGEAAGDLPLVDAGGAVVSPGVVDVHVHVDEPGRSHWEGFATATRAAAAGGVTTLVDMPLNSIPATTTAAALAEKRRAAAGKCAVDVGFWGGVVPGNTAELAPLAAAGALGFKCFLAPSGVAEFAPVGEAELRPAMGELARLGAVLLAHAELPALLDDGWAGAPGEAGYAARCRSYRAYLTSRPPAAEVAAIGLLARLAADTGCRVHVVHVASAEAVAAVRAARAAGVAMTAETCPHYLTACAEEIGDGETLWKCAPPVREGRHREALWRALDERVLDLVASDHSPSPPAGKHLATGDCAAAWGGIASLQLTLPLVWSGLERRGLGGDAGLERLAEWLSAAPARLAGLAAKGAIAAGRDADLVLWRSEAVFTVDPARLYHRHPITPYAGRGLAGVVERTFVRGVEVWDGERVHGEGGERPAGSLLTA